MTRVLTADEWQILFPDWPPGHVSETDADDIADANEIDVLSIAMLYEPWPGTDEPAAADARTILHRVGRWYLIRDGIGCLGTSMFIEAERLDEPDWLYYLLKNKRIYDPSDFLKTLESARARLRPAEHPDQREAAMQQQIARATQSWTLVIRPDILRKFHVYFAHRINAASAKEAFCRFLAAQGYVPRL